MYQRLIFSMTVALATLICLSHIHELTIYITVGMKDIHDMKLQQNTIRIYLIGDKSIPITAAAILSEKYPQRVPWKLYKEIFPDLEVPDSQRRIREKSFSHCGNLTILLILMPPPITPMIHILLQMLPTHKTSKIPPKTLMHLILYP